MSTAGLALLTIAAGVLFSAFVGFALARLWAVDPHKDEEAR